MTDQRKPGGQQGHQKNSKVVKEGRELKERLDQIHTPENPFKTVEKAIKEAK